MGDRRVDYDRVAAEYDRRYEGSRYAGAERFLREWIGTARRVLEVGCGTGHWLDALAAPGRRIFGVDRSAGMLAKARAALPAARVARAEALRLPFGDARFDAIVCVNALHHFPDKARFIEEAARVLTPGGAFCSIGLDPHRGARRWAVYEYFDGTLEADRRRYPPHEAIQRWLADAGFVDCRSAVANRVSERVPAERGLASPMMRKDGTSQLALLSDSAYRRGVRRIRDAMAGAEREGRVLELHAELELLATTGRRGAWSVRRQIRGPGTDALRAEPRGAGRSRRPGRGA